MKSPLAYYQALICESGHLISGNCSDFPVESVKYCPPMWEPLYLFLPVLRRTHSRRLLQAHPCLRPEPLQ